MVYKEPQRRGHTFKWHIPTALMFVKGLFSTLISLGLLHGVSGATITTSASTTDPTAIIACKPTFGGFALYAQRMDTKAKYPVRLLSTGDAGTTHMVISTNDVGLFP